MNWLFLSLWLQIFSLSLTEVEPSTEAPLKTTPKIPGAPYFVESPINATVLVDETFVLPCRIAGKGQIKITWWHYYEEVRRRGTYHRIQKSGNLKFHRIMPSHQGFYRCEGNNSIGIVRSKLAYLRVHAPATIIDGPSNKRVKEGETVHAKCFVAGDPEPNITWKIDGVPIFDENTQKIYNKQEYKFNATKTVKIECMAENVNIRGYSNDSKVAVVHVSEIPRGYCERYEGRLCELHIGNRLVWYNLSSPANISDEQEVAVLSKWKELILSVSAPCRQSIEAMLCEVAFPSCINSTKLPTIQPVCREHCMAMRKYFCHNEWDNLLSKPLFSNVHLPKCSTLPSSHSKDGRHARAGGPQSCTKVKIFQVDPSQLTHNCYEKDGQNYKGPVNETEQNYPCQSWNEHVPHVHPDLTPLNFPILMDSANQCRNPGGLRERPWCYIMSAGAGQIWQYCDIPKCVSNNTNVHGKRIESVIQREFFQKETIVIIVIVSVISVSLVMIISVLIYCICKQQRRIKYNRAYPGDVDIDIEKLPSNECFDQEQAEIENHPVLGKVEYPRNDIVFMCDIGKGAFGSVFKAKAPNITEGQDATVVVVKMLKDNVTDDMRLNFEQEAALLVELNHPNIIKLLGACAIGKPMCLLFEYMGNGDLTQFLKAATPKHSSSKNRSEEILAKDGFKLSNADQLFIGEQICSAMLYLSDLGYVHRDLATRNCLVGDNLVVKISDFSLARQVNEADGIYIGNDNDAIPVRWMPLEAIMLNRFSMKSDVWSFGVVMWEIFAFAFQPYFELETEEIVRYVGEGQILISPEDTPEEVYDLMQICWELDPEKRPPFHTLHSMICSLREGLLMMQKQVSDSD